MPFDENLSIYITPGLPKTINNKLGYFTAEKEKEKIFFS